MELELARLGKCLPFRETFGALESSLCNSRVFPSSRKIDSKGSTFVKGS